MSERPAFDQLRAQIAAALSGATALLKEPRLIPFEQTLEGWYCLTDGGAVVHVADNGAIDSTSLIQTVALLGAASRKYPLAALFIPQVERVVCDACGGFDFSGEAHGFMVEALGRPLAQAPAASPRALRQAERAIGETLEHHAHVQLRAAA